MFVPYLQQSTEITFYHPTVLTPTWLSTARRKGEVKYRIWLARRLWSGHRWKLWDLLHSLQGLWHLKVIYEYYSYHGNWILLCPDSHGNRFQLGLDFKSTGPFVNGLFSHASASYEMFLLGCRLLHISFLAQRCIRVPVGLYIRH